MYFKLLNSFLLLLTLEATASPWNIRMRAREHFVENHSLHFADNKQYQYAGLSNTINIWQEVPFVYSLGLSISPALGQSKPKGAIVPELGSSFELRAYGVEGKYYPIKHGKVFLRAGVSHISLATKGLLGVVNGHGYYIGLGYEFPFYMIHLAPEIAYRMSELDQGIQVKTTMFAIGFHFYKNL
jgi:hypothetical protein